MPLWQIYHPAGTFEDDASKQAFAKDITQMYTELGLPSFYVVAYFHKQEHGDAFIGGTCKAPGTVPFIRVVINHIAIHVPDVDQMYLRTTSRLDQIMKPHLVDKGYDFEYHVSETERRLWKINGLIPPQFKSEEEQLWVRENRPVLYEGAFPPAVGKGSG